MKNIIKILLICVLLATNTATAVCDYVWEDEFTSRNSRWDWGYDEGAGYKQLTTINGFSLVEIGITDRASSSSYSDCSLHEKYYHYNTGVFEMRLRYTGNNEFGTLGWGVWNYENPQAAEAAWFWSSTTGGVAVGFQAMVAYGGIIRFQEHLPEINIQEWHTYRVDLLPTGTRFLVDGNEVAFTPLRPNKSQRFEIWVDNYRMKVTNGRLEPIGYLYMNQDNRIYIDWVKYYEECVEENLPPAPIHNLHIVE